MLNINNFHKGQSLSPYTTDGAYSKSANLDVFSQPGIAKINYKPVKKSGEVVDELIYNFVRPSAPYESTDWYDPTATGGTGNNNWTNPANAYASNDSYATYEEPPSSGAYQLYYIFNCDVPSGVTVTGIEVQVEGKAASGSRAFTVWLTKNATSYPATFTSYKSTKLTTTEQYHTFGGRTDKWGWGWTADEINSSGFGIRIGATEATVVYSVDHIRVKIYYLRSLNVVYASGENGSIYQSADSGDTWTLLASSKGRYIKFWKGYLFAILDNVINVYYPTGDSWTDDWKTDLETTSEHFMLVSENDGNLYICNEKKVASVVELTTFDPANSDTFTYTLDHLTLYDPYQAVCLGEHREDLLVGAVQGTSSDPKVSSSIFIWDREAGEFQYPLFLSGEFITAILEVQNRTYIITDLYGKIYSYSESGLIPLKQLPFDYDNGKHIRIGHKGHQSMGFWRNRILLGVSSTDELNPAGIYGLYGEAVNCEHLISTGEDGSNDDLIIGGVYPLDGDTLLYGYYDAETVEYGIDKISSTHNRATGYVTYLESLFYQAGTHLKPVNYRQTEVQLSRPLQAGEGVKLYYRKNIEDEWILLGTFDYTTIGAKSSLLLDKGVFGIINIQIKAELTTGASSQNTPLLFDIRFM